MSAALTFLIEGSVMSVSAKKMSDVLCRMACLFRPPLNLLEGGATNEVARLWTSVLGDDFDDESIAAAALLLARTLRRFPVPADFLEIAVLVDTKKSTAETAAQGA